MESHWRRLNRALDHIQTLDRSICRWLNGDAYRIVKEHDAKTGRTAYVARITEIPAEWPNLVGDAVHGLRSALDHLAFALNSKGYADAHNGDALPSDVENASAFPIFGNENNKGEPTDGEAGFRSKVSSYRHMPEGAKVLIERLQPYQRRDGFTSDPLWGIHVLSRIDKHRIDLDVTAQAPEQRIDFQAHGFVAEAGLGAGGAVYDGKELSYWVIPKDAREPDTDFAFRRGVAFGQGTLFRNQPVVPTLRGIRNFIRYKVAFPLDRFL
jgi:hypothetical protein